MAQVDTSSLELVKPLIASKQLGLNFHIFNHLSDSLVKLWKQELEAEISDLLESNRKKTQKLKKGIMLACLFYVFWALTTVPIFSQLGELASLMIITLLIISLLAFIFYGIREMLTISSTKSTIAMKARLINLLDKGDIGENHQLDIINRIKYK